MDECIVIYIDDILVYFKNEDDREQDLMQLLGKLKQSKLLANDMKIDFLLGNSIS